MKKAVRLVGFYAGLVLLWQLLYKLKVWPPYVFPSPASVLKALRQGFADHSFWIGLAVSLKRVLIGYFISVVAGIALGVLIAGSQTLEETIGGLVMSLQSLPSICWLPLAVLWFGLNEKAILFVIVMGSLLAVTLDTTLGIRHVPKIYLMAGHNLGAHGPRMFFPVPVPASLPHLVSGLKHGWAFAWRSLISGEMIFRPRPASDDGPRLERHEPGDRSNDSDHGHGLLCGSRNLRADRTPHARKVGPRASRLTCSAMSRFSTAPHRAKQRE